MGIGIREVAAAVVDGVGAVGVGEFDAKGVLDEVKNHLADGCAVRVGRGTG